MEKENSVKMDNQSLLLRLVKDFETKLTEIITGEKLGNLDNSDNLERAIRIIYGECKGIEEKSDLNSSMVMRALEAAINDINDTFSGLEDDTKDFYSTLKVLKEGNEDAEELKELEKEYNDKKRYLKNLQLVTLVFKQMKDTFELTENQQAESLKPKIKFLAIPESTQGTTTLGVNLPKNIEDQKILYSCLNKMENLLMESCKTEGDIAIIKTARHGDGLHKVGNYTVYKNISNNIRIFFERRENYIFVLGTIKTHGNAFEETREKDFYREMHERLNSFLNATDLTDKKVEELEENYQQTKRIFYEKANKEKSTETEITDLDDIEREFINQVSSNFLSLQSKIDDTERLDSSIKVEEHGIYK